MNTPERDIVLWGHTFEEYVRMFDLTDNELNLSILDCCGGPSSFNAVLTKRGGRVISSDSLFSLSKEQMQQQIEKVFNEMLSLVEINKERFTWNAISTPQQLATIRKQSIEIFLNDFEAGKKQGRYLDEIPPHLNFKPDQFDLALSSHYFFANGEDQSVDFHIDAIKNLCEVAKEVRIFPLLNSQGEIPEIVGPVTQNLYQHSLGVEIKAVPYQFQAKGNAMLRVWAQACEI